MAAISVLIVLAAAAAPVVHWASKPVLPGEMVPGTPPLDPNLTAAVNVTGCMPEMPRLL